MHFCTHFIAASAIISVASAALFNVTVAKDHQLTYDPPFLTGVKSGDVIGFQFATGTHTVTQSTFDKPCDKKSGGFDSGIISSAGNPSWTLTVDDASAPLWFNCVPHCTRGMVFAINPTADNTFDAFSAAAKGQTPSSSTTTATTPSTISSTTASVYTTPGGATTPGATTSGATTSSATSASGTDTSAATTSTPTAAGALGQLSTDKVALWLSTLSVIVCWML